MQSNYDSGISTAVDTFPISGTTMTYNASTNELNVVYSGGETSYPSGSLLKISINSNAEYEIENPGPSIGSYNYNVQLSHSNLQCFVIKQRGNARTGIGVNDFRDFKVKNTWDLDACAIGLDLADSVIEVGFASDSSPCYVQEEAADANCR